ncbi:MAG: pyrophosphatase [bacterium]|nr:pyrophosphatase [bacterium]
MELKKLTEKIKEVMELYKSDYPKVKVDRDYFPFKLTEELGECIQAYLMYTDRGRQKGKSKEEIKKIFEKELADVFGFLILFAEHEGIDLAKAVENKWFSYLEGNEKKPE